MKHHKHKNAGAVRVSAADLARLLAVSPQQVGRWRADGVLAFGTDGLADAYDAVRAIFAWAGHGREPMAARHLRDRARGSDYWRGLDDGMMMMFRVVMFYREQAQAKKPPASVAAFYAPSSDAEPPLVSMPPLDADALLREYRAAQDDLGKLAVELGLGD